MAAVPLRTSCATTGWPLDYSVCRHHRRSAYKRGERVIGTKRRCDAAPQRWGGGKKGKILSW
ncbi:ABC-type antimicrobial peptide transport system, ATPase component [Sesbania bispinosa]|nr:ABC-type antimicrobial peptide transport system, ATPase component [Sesbania bispinosa]